MRRVTLIGLTILLTWSCAKEDAWQLNAAGDLLCKKSNPSDCRLADGITARKTADRPSETPSRTKQLEAQFHSWDGSHINLERFVKKTMHNPRSYEHVETRYSDKGDHLVVVTKFRGTNAFGGVVMDSMGAKVDMQGNIIEILPK
jgi:hypothetical protein